MDEMFAPCLEGKYSDGKDKDGRKKYKNDSFEHGFNTYCANRRNKVSLTLTLTLLH